MDRFYFARIAAVIWLYGLFFPSAVAAESLVQALEHHAFSTVLRERMLAFNKQYLDLRPVLPIEHMPCPKAQRYAQRVLDQIIQGSSPTLREMLIRADFSVTITVTCDIASLPDAEMKAGLLDVSAALILLLSSEDEVAAVLAHELAHFTLAHDHKGMETFSQLTPFALKRFRMQQEEEADAESLTLLANAGYDPYAAVEALISVRDFIRASQIRTDERHPQINDRIKTLKTQFLRGTFTRVPRRKDGFEAVKEALKLWLDKSAGFVRQ